MQLKLNLINQFLIIVSIFGFSWPITEDLFEVGPFFYEESSDCRNSNGKPQLCQPEFINVAFNRHFHSTNTCQDGEDFCIRTGSTGSFCDVCEENQFHVRHLTDNVNNTWWQSSSMLRGTQYPHSVNLTLDLGNLYQITYIRLKFHSLRPESFAIYKRNDPNDRWTPFQYYSSSCYETYGQRSNEDVTWGREDVALCSDQHTHTLPTSGGIVAFSTLQGRPSARDFKNNEQLQNWVTAKEIKIVLNRMNTFGDELFKDPNVLKSYFYAISDIAIGGRCSCNGHASSCSEGSCNCEHHTTGSNCQRCLPLYNALPWKKATEEKAHECKQCNCNGFSHKCFFDEEMYRRTGDGGHCIECTDNRFGAHCELCSEGFYAPSPKQHCIPCSCNPIGSHNPQCDMDGRCACKQGVTGEKCDKCMPNFYQLTTSGCRPCECSVAGSLDNKPVCNQGVCACKENVDGEGCQRCKEGYYGLSSDNELGCLPCRCNGRSKSCQVSQGYYVAEIHSHFHRGDSKWRGIGRDGRVVNAEIVGQSIQVTSMRDAHFLAPNEFLGDIRLSYNLELSFNFRDPYQQPPTPYDIIIEAGNGNKATIPFSGQNNPVPSSASQSYRFKLNEHAMYEWRIEGDLFAILSDVQAIKIRATGQLNSFKLQTAVQGYGGQTAMNVERCECPREYVGQYCESCAPGFKIQNDPISLVERCVPCDCNGHSDVCDPISGRCTCQDNTAGDNCAVCAPGYYGDAVNGGRDACRACPCPEGAQCEVRHDGHVVCSQCLPGYAGDRCELCADGYYGDPQGLRGVRRSCQQCNCNGNVDPDVEGNCDQWTGECLRCIHNTAGSQCERCLPNHFGNPLAFPRGQCKPCECDRVGSLEDQRGDTCNTYTGQCVCKPNVVGTRCDQCAPGFWNFMSNRGCERCYCNAEGSADNECDSRTGACVCNKGVGGERCEECLPGYYGMSFSGCLKCACNIEGSTGQECDRVTGQCQCRAGIEGRTCDRCAKNKYLDVGGYCVDCPECYKMVETEAEMVKQKLSELKVFVNYILHDNRPIDDHRIFHEIHSLNNTLMIMWRKIEGAKKGAGVPSEVISRKQKEIYELIRMINTIQVVVGSAHDRCSTGASDLHSALDRITEMEQKLSSNEQKIQREGLVTLRRVYEAQKHHGIQSQSLTRLAHEARTLAEELERTSQRIEQLTNDALRDSEEAMRLAHLSQKTPGTVATEIEGIKRQLSQLNQEHQRTKNEAENSMAEARKAYEDSLELLTAINSLHVPVTSKNDERVKEYKEMAERLSRNADEILRKNNRIINDLRHRLQVARDTLLKAIRQQQILDEMVAEMDAARARGMQAIRDADDVYHRATTDLRTLQQFDEKVKNSKRASIEALHRREEIQRKVKEAEDLTNMANRKLANSDQDALKSKQMVDEAAITLEKALQMLNEMENKTVITKKELLQFDKETYKFKIKMDEVIGKMEEARRNIEEDEKRIQLAKEDSDMALWQSNQVLNEMTSFSRQFEQMLYDMYSIESYDPVHVDLLEENLKQMEMNYNGRKTFEEIQRMQQINLGLNVMMDEYESLMTQLHWDIENIRAINNTLPRTCFSSVNLEPVDPRSYI